MPKITEREKEIVTIIFKREYLKLYGHRLKSKKLEQYVDNEIKKAIKNYEELT